MNQQRPVNLELTAFKFPLPAITSILHRITGVVLFLGLPFLLCVFDQSLESNNSFIAVKQWLDLPVVKLFVLVYLAALSFHLVAGFKHLLMDIGFAETKGGAKQAAIAVFVITALIVIFLGVWIW